MAAGTLSSTRAWRRWKPAVVVLGGFVWLAGFATVQSPPAEGIQVATDSPIVFVMPMDLAAEESESVLRAVKAHTLDLASPLIIERPPATPPRFLDRVRQAMMLAGRHGARGVFWVELYSGEDIMLYLVEPDGLRTLARRIPRVRDSEAATVESLGVVVRSVSDALIAGGRIGMTPVEVRDESPVADQKPEPAKSPPPAKPVRWGRVRMAVGYVGNTFGNTLPWQNGIVVSLDVRPIRPLVLGFSYDAVFPSTVENDLVRIELRRHPSALYAGFVAEPVRRLLVEAQAAFSIDALTRETVGIATGAAPDATFVLFTLGPRLRIGGNPWAGLQLHLDAGFEVVLNNVDYVVELQPQGERRTILDAHAVRGRVSAGIGYAFF